MLLKEEKIEHESGEDSLKGTTEPTNLRPIVSPFLPTTPQVTRFKLKKKKEKKHDHATECKPGSKKRSKRLKLSVLFFLKLSFTSLLLVLPLQQQHNPIITRQTDPCS